VRRLPRLCLALLVSLIGLNGAAIRAVEGGADLTPIRLYFPFVGVGSGAPVADGLPALADFVTAVANGEAGVVRGVYVPVRFALPVRQQPAGEAAYVSSEDGVVTQFGLAAGFGVTGLLAHNYLAGARFFELIEADALVLVFGDGGLKTYAVSDIQRYRALQPYSPYSDFVDLETGAPLSATDLFLRVYVGDDHVTFQTCIELDGNPIGGRLFVIATPTP
jgi:hypothetical protein